MPRENVDAQLHRVDVLSRDITSQIPANRLELSDFRAELAGLLVVSMASSYENSVKEILVGYAACRHVDFEYFASQSFSKLNSRISYDDLSRYAKHFGAHVHASFDTAFKQRRDRIYNRTKMDIKSCYSQILSWRHDYAHSGIRNTTVEEAIVFHRYAKRVLYCFDEALSCPP